MLLVAPLRLSLKHSKRYLEFNYNSFWRMMSFGLSPNNYSDQDTKNTPRQNITNLFFVFFCFYFSHFRWKVVLSHRMIIQIKEGN